VSHLDLRVLRVWPGARRPGLAKAEAGAIAGPGAAQRRRLIIIKGDFGNASWWAAAEDSVTRFRRLAQIIRVRL